MTDSTFGKIPRNEFNMWFVAGIVGIVILMLLFGYQEANAVGHDCIWVCCDVSVDPCKKCLRCPDGHSHEINNLTPWCPISPTIKSMDFVITTVRIQVPEPIPFWQELFR